MSCVVGIDLSSRFIDLVSLDENADYASWLRVELEGDTAWDRIRSIADWMPSSSWWDNIYLVAIERPFSQSRNDVVRLAEGAVVASIPSRVETWEVAPQTWKAALGIRKGKPDWSHFPTSFARENWASDALDALGVALWARNTNAALVARALEGAA